jgi:hypothetical protein
MKRPDRLVLWFCQLLAAACLAFATRCVTVWRARDDAGSMPDETAMIAVMVAAALGVGAIITGAVTAAGNHIDGLLPGG